MFEAAPHQAYDTMNFVLHLPASFERQYWAWPVTRRAVAAADRYGLVVSIFVKNLIANMHSHRVDALHTWLAAALQLAQLVWLLTGHSSHLRWRLPLAMVQRMRW
jgi:hypothetical protein